MRIVVLGAPAARESAKKLAQSLEGKAFIDLFPAINKCNVLINYGNSYIPPYYEGAKTVLNYPNAVRNCINKIETFKILKKAGVKIPQFATNKKDIGKDWDTVVIRSSVNGAKNDGISFWHRWHKKKLPEAPLYTRYYGHKKELRVCLLRHGKQWYVEAYEKIEDGKGSWELFHVNRKVHDFVKDQCILAAEALKIDYVGFDVLYNSYAEFVILEANSAPVLTEEMVNHFKQLLEI